MLNHRIALSAFSIIASLALMGGATFAAFTSAASNNGNTFGTGSMVLKINGAAGSASTPVFSIAAAVPGDSSTQKLTLTNTGSVPQTTVQVTGITVSGANPELAAKLTLQLFDDVNDNGVLDIGETVYKSAHLDDASWTNFVLSGVSLPATTGVSHVGTKLTFDSNADGSFQSKSLSFNIGFQGNQ